MNRDFLKEAIADAKAVKESAIANAKVALEEAFTPQVQAMFASRLEEMELEEAEEGDEEVTEAKAKKQYKDDDRKDGGESKETKRTEKMKYGKDLAEGENLDEEFNLDEILAELEKDELDENARTDAEEEGYKDGMKDEKEDLKEDERTDAEEEGYLDGEEDEKEDTDNEEDVDIDLEDMSEDDLKKFIEDVIEDMVTTGELEAGEEFEVDGEETEDGEIDIEVEDEEEVTVDENARTDAEEEGYKDGMKDMKSDLGEAMSTIAILKSELNEINLLNAKLLYTNKVFRGKNLTEDQKVKVLSAFDRAETVKEAKLVFETIDSSVKSKLSTKKPVSENFRGKGSASNLTSTPRVNKKRPIVESNEMVTRFQKLAGIIKG
jgi:hypothetical protein